MFDPISMLIQLVVGVVLSLASNLLQQAFGSPSADKATGTRGSASVGGKIPQYFLMGTVGEAGKREYRNAWGAVGGVPNAYTVDVYSFGDLPISGMTGLYVNGVRVADPSGTPVDQGLPVSDYNDGADHLWVKFYSGNQSAADAYLVDKFGADADRPWGADMVGVGIPYIITTALWSETLFTGFPSFVGEFQGIPLYDPREDDTAGGSGDQRWDDQSTWTFSDNNAVMIYNIERGIHFDGAKVWGGDATEAQLPYDAWADAMDACDLAINLVGGGTEKQFRAGRRISLNERPGDVIKELMIGANMRICHAADGTIYPLVGVPAVADGAFSDADVLGTDPLGSIPFPNLDSIINGATATYREPEQAWEDKETAPYLRSDLEAEDDGRQQLEGLSLGTTFSGTQAQRILKAVIEEGRRFKTHVVALPPEFAQFRPLQVLAWTDPSFGYVAKLFLITARTRSPWGQVIFGLQEIDPADHDWVPAEDEHPLSFAPVVTNRPAPQTVSAPSVAPVPGELAFDAFWSSASVAVDVNFVRITYRLPSDDTSRVTIPIPKPDLLAGSARIPVALSLSATPIEVQLEYIPGSGRAMVASAWMPVTIADVKLTPADFYPDLESTLEVLNQGLEWLAQSNKRVRDDLQSVVVRLQDQGNLTDENFQQVWTKLTAERDALSTKLTADYDLKITTAVGVIDGQLVAQSSRIETLDAQIVDANAGITANANAIDAVVVTVTSQGGTLTAHGLAITAVETSVGDISADGKVKIESFASPGGGWSRVGIQARVSLSDVWTTAAILLDAKTDGTSRALLVADNVAVVDTGGTVSAMFEAGTAYLAAARIQDGSIVNAKIANATITSAKLVDATITSAKIADAAITSAKIGTAAITSAKIGDLEVDTIKINGTAIADDVVSSGTSGSVSSGSVPIYYYSTSFVATGKVLPYFCKYTFTKTGGTGQFSKWLRLHNVTTNTYTELDYLLTSEGVTNFSGLLTGLTTGHTYRLAHIGSYSDTAFDHTINWVSSVIVRKR